MFFCLNHNIFNTQWLSVSPYYFTSKKGETKNTSFFIVNISWKIKDSKAHLSVRQTVLDAIASHFLPDRQMQARSGEFLFRKKRAEERSRPFGSGGFFSPHQNAASFFLRGVSIIVLRNNVASSIFWSEKGKHATEVLFFKETKNRLAVRELGILL